MLKQRILTAAVLLAVFAAALAVPTAVPFLVLTLLLIATAGWEWSRLVGWSGRRAWASGALCAALGLAVFGSAIVTIAHGLYQLGLWIAMGLAALWVVTVLLWIFGGAWLLWRGVAHWSKLPQWLRWSLGMVVLIVTWLALAQALGQGINFLLSVLVLVWAADTAAYFCGRALGGKLTGGRKLAPTISPGKSWEGAAGGFIGVLLTSAIWIGVDHAYPSWSLSLYSILWQRGPLWFVGGLALLTVMSIVGDLTESLVKRAAGVKDSSALLPGHGGVLDRIDALLPTLPLAILIAYVAPTLG
jgi:phosphatidate cytidylyltransferase